MCGKTFTVTQQDDEESSTTTARLSNRKQRSWCFIYTISQTYINCFLKSRRTPDIMIFIVSGRGLNLECHLLSCKRGSKGWSGLHITCFYSTAEFYTRFLCRWIHTNTHTHTGENTDQVYAGDDARFLNFRQVWEKWDASPEKVYEKVRGCVLDTHLFFARLKSSEYQRSPEAPGDHNLEGQLSKHTLKTRTISFWLL